MKRSHCGFVLLSLAILHAGLSVAAEQAVLRRSHFAGPDAIDPHLIRGHGAANTIAADLFVGLTALDRFGSIVPGMAEEWDVSADGLVYTFRIRPDARWSDGERLDATDFDYSLRRVLAGDVPAPYAHYLFPIRSAQAVFERKRPPEELGIKVQGPHTLVIELEHPTPYFLDVLSLAVASPVPEHVVEPESREWTMATNIVTNGPFVLVEYVPQDHLLLRKNPLFVEHDQISLDFVEYLIVQDRTTALRRFRAGEIDIEDGGFPASQLPWLMRNMPEVVHTAPRRQLQYCAVNHEAPPFDDLRVRRALSLAVNRQILVEKVLQTPDLATNRLVPPYTGNYGKSVSASYAGKSMPQRQQEARKLLAEAGFPSDNPLELTLSYSTDADNKRIAVALAAMWKAVGIQARLYNAESGTHHRAVAQGDYEIARLSWGAEVDDPQSFMLLLKADSPVNHGNYSNPAYDRLVEAGMFSSSIGERAELFAAAEQLALDDQALLPLFFVAARNLVATRVTGWHDTERFARPSRYLGIHE